MALIVIFSTCKRDIVPVPAGIPAIRWVFHPPYTKPDRDICPGRTKRSNELSIDYTGHEAVSAGAAKRQAAGSTSGTVSNGANDALHNGMSQSDRIRAAALACLDDTKAEDVVAIDLKGKSAIADCMVIASGRSQRHVGSVADYLVEAFKKAGCKTPRVEGMAHCDWVLVDAGDVLVHVFRPEVRDFYNLERLWSADMPEDQLAN